MAGEAPISDSTANDVRACVERGFSAADVPEVLELLERYGTERHEKTPHFMRLAVLRMVNGDRQRLEEWVTLAKHDYRDLLLSIHQTYGHHWLEPFLAGRRESPEAP